MVILSIKIFKDVFLVRTFSHISFSMNNSLIFHKQPFIVFSFGSLPSDYIVGSLTDNNTSLDVERSIWSIK